jgi:AcrR family transcriptional regulator
MTASTKKRRSARPPAATARGEDTRSRLIESAYQQFLRHGFHGTSMRQIAEGAGIAVGGIYNHFHSKQAIFAAVLDAYHPYRVILPALEATEGETLEEFFRNASRLIRGVVEGAEEQLLPLIFIDLVEFQGQHLKDMAEMLFPIVTGFIQRFYGARGHLRELPLPVIMRTFFALMVGYLTTQLVMRGSRVFGPMGFDWYGGMMDIFVYGIVDKAAAPADGPVAPPGAATGR